MFQSSKTSSGKATKAKPYSLLQACGLTSCVAIGMIILAWSPFWRINMAVQDRFVLCVREENLTFSNKTSFQQLTICDIERAVNDSDLKFVGSMNPDKLAGHLMKTWDWYPKIFHTDFYVAYLVQSYDMWHLGPVELLGGVMAGFYVIVLVFERLELWKLQSRAELLEKQLMKDLGWGEISRLDFPWAEGHSGQKLTAAILRNKLDGMMKKTLDDPKLSSLRLHWLFAFFLLIAHLCAPSFLRRSGISGEETTLPSGIREWVWTNHVL